MSSLLFVLCYHRCLVASAQSHTESSRPSKSSPILKHSPFFFDLNKKILFILLNDRKKIIFILLKKKRKISFFY